MPSRINLEDPHVDKIPKLRQDALLTIAQRGQQVLSDDYTDDNYERNP
jgi:hypothetical protein